MLINLRNALMAGKRLPYDAEVEYLESTGTQWIATGISAARTSSSIKIVATLKFTDVSTGEHDLAGSGNATTPTMGRNGSNYFMWAKGGTSWYPAACDTNWHTVSYTFNQPSGRVFELDGVSYTGSQSNTFATGDGIHIFASGPNRYPLNCQLSKLEIWQNGVLVRDFIPVRKGTVGYLYDRVSGKLFGNAGAGDFVIGQDVVPVEYIQSNGTEYIDTGVIPTTGTAFEVSAAFTDLTVGRFGAITSPGDIRYYFGVASGKWIGGVKSTSYNHNIATADTLKHLFKIDDTGLYIDGVKRINAGADAVTTSFYLFNVHGSNANLKASAKLYGCNITRSGTDIGKHIPIRVGTEGAMMDVLTRRIYRNAGTGAFGYGNDLKYPIPAA